MNLNASDITIFLLSISLMLFLARGFGELLRKFNQPLVIGEILAGIILGPTVFGALFPETFDYLFTSSPVTTTALSGITTLAVVMLMLVTGLEIDLGLALRQGKIAASISFLGLVFPFAVGFGIAYLYPELLGMQNPELRLVFSLFIGTALSITALPVVAKVLMDLKIFKTEVGFVIITSAMINDLIGWMIFSVILGMMGTEAHGLRLEYLLLTLFTFVLIVLIIGRKILHYFIPILNKYTSFPGGILNFVFILGFLAAAFSESIGVHAIFGAFIIGIAIGDSTHLKEETREIIHQFVTNIFAPLFFVSIGLRVNFVQNFDPVLVLVFILLAFIGKVFGCGLGAYISGKSIDDSLVIGFGMNARGAMEIILGLLALQAGLITEKVFVALVVMALVTSISSAPLMSLFLRRSRKKLTFKGLLKPEIISIRTSTNKSELIKELCSGAASINNLDMNKLFNEVLKREEQLSTGLVNGLAIPHTRMDISKPIVAISVHKKGIDFDSLDSKPAHFIVLLVTPIAEPELQLKLLAEISKPFENDELTSDLVKCESIKEIFEKLKNVYNQ